MGPPTTIASNAPAAPRQVDSGGTGLLEQVRLAPLMALTSGSPEVVVGVIDGPVADHPDLAEDRIRALPGRSATCAIHDEACVHGTAVAGILAGRRGMVAPAICPGCTLLVRPVLGVRRLGSGDRPGATQHELATAMLECIEGGARIVNVSAALTELGAHAERGQLAQVLDLAASRGVVVVVAAGNQGVLTGSSLTRHPWALPVIACARSGQPLESATLGASIGRRGLGAPGEQVTSLAPGGRSQQFGGSSAAAPFVTGAAALIWSRFPRVSGAEIRFALTSSAGRRRRGVVPPLLDAWEAYLTVAAHAEGRPGV